MKRRESGGTLSGSGGTFRSPEPLRPLLPPFFRLQGHPACQLPSQRDHIPLDVSACDAGASKCGCVMLSRAAGKSDACTTSTIHNQEVLLAHIL